MDVTSGDKEQGAVTFTESGGDITEMHVGVSVSVSYNSGHTGVLSTSVDVWPDLTVGQKTQMNTIKDKIDAAVAAL